VVFAGEGEQVRRVNSRSVSVVTISIMGGSEITGPPGSGEPVEHLVGTRRDSGGHRASRRGEQHLPAGRLHRGHHSGQHHRAGIDVLGGKPGPHGTGDRISAQRPPIPATDSGGDALFIVNETPFSSALGLEDVEPGVPGSCTRR
jgi:hypothetical protein